MLNPTCINMQDSQRENETLLKANEKLNQEKENLLKDKNLADSQIGELTKSWEALQKDL